MKYKNIFAVGLLASMLISCFPTYAFADNEKKLNADAEKKILSSDDFSDGLSSWTGTSDFYVLNKQLVFNNTRKTGQTSKLKSTKHFIENGEIAFDIKMDEGNYFALLFRMEDDDTHYALRFYYKSNKTVLLKKINGGSYITVATGNAELEYGKTSNVCVTLIGGNITLKVDGKTSITAKDISLKSGNVAFEGSSAKVIVDNFEIFKFNDVEYDVEDVSSGVKKKVYVSLTGSDTEGDGSEQKPLKTIEAAKKKANSLKQGNNAVDIIFDGGIYNFSNTFEIGYNDSGSKNAPIRYMANEGEKVVFSGAKSIDVTKFKTVTDDEILERMYPEVSGKVVAVDLGEQGFTKEELDFTSTYYSVVGNNLKPVQLSLNGEIQKISRWPNSGYNVITLCEPGDNMRYGGSREKGGTIYYSGTQPSRWLKAQDVFLEGFFMYAWAGEWARIKEIDINKNALNFEFFTSYGIGNNNRWAAVHLLEEIDIPGEWFIDFDNLILYYYPVKELTASDKMEVTVLNKNLLNIKDASDIEINGIEFSMIGADFSVSKTSNAGGNAIYIENSKNVNIKNCTISHVGMNGIYISSNDVTVDGCVIHDIGFDGVSVVKTGDRTTLTTGNVQIKNNQISDVCRNTGANAFAGIVMGYNTVGVEVKNNIIHNCLNSAIRYAGNGHHIWYNEIHNAVNKSSDAGAIYSGRSWTQYGTVTEYNYFHGIGDRNSLAPTQAHSMFWDDYHSGNEFSHNISVMQNYLKTSHVHLGGGVDNTIKGNTLVSSQWGIYATDRSSSVKDYREYSVSTLNYGEFDVKSEVYASKYPKMSTILERLLSDEGVLKIENYIGNNLVVDSTEGNIIGSSLVKANTAIPLNNKDMGSDFSIFVDPENQDYRVKKEAKEMYGISDEILDETFDLNLIGIQKEYKIDESKMKSNLLYPENGIENVDKAKLQLVWSKADLADGYRYIIAEDPEFKNIVVDKTTIETVVMPEGLKNNTTYYWKVIAYNESRQIGCEREADGGVRSFTTSEFGIINKQGIEKEYANLVDLLNTVKEGNMAGQYAPGTINLIKEKMVKAEEYLSLEYGEQAELDEFAFELNRFIDGIDVYANPGYTTLNLTSKSDWFAMNNKTKITPANGAVTITNTENTGVTLKETLSNYNVMCFDTRLENLDGWVAYGLRALDERSAIYSQDAYYILVKKDIFELQKHGKIYATAPNNGKMVPGKWYNVQFGSITTANGINMYFALDGEVIFDFLDKSNPQYKPGMFAMFISGANTIDIKAEANVKKEMYVMSDAIKAEVNKKEEDGDAIDTEHTLYSETGVWGFKNGVLGDYGAVVRTTKTKDATAKWVMETGSKGNDKIYKVSYYHLPTENGDKNAKITMSGYAGSYETTVDLSSGEEGWVEIGTFKFADADYIGRLSVIFTASGNGEMNVSNVKYELVEDGNNMLK